MSLIFYRRWLKAPLRVGAVSPSGARLAQIITSELSADSGPIVEFGPGTGVFTRSILDKGIPPEDLYCLELDGAFVRSLRAAFPKVNILNESATDIATKVPVEPGSVGAVVSGLPLLSMGKAAQTAILDGVFKMLRPGGAFYQFTYGWKVPVPTQMLRDRGIEFQVIGRTLRNIPPARVYRMVLPQEAAVGLPRAAEARAA